MRSQIGREEWLEGYLLWVCHSRMGNPQGFRACGEVPSLVEFSPTRTIYKIAA
jgi:hypothetical protein